MAKTRVQIKKIDTERKRRVEKAGWYFAKLAYLAIPWKAKDHKNPRGTLFRRYHLIQAKSIRSAYAKADHILSFCEQCDGSGNLNGERVIVTKVGILDLQPMYEKLASGVELYDESETGSRYLNICKEVVTKQERARMAAYKRRNGKQAVLDVWFGPDFDKI